MISLQKAKALKEAGLVWKTAINDFFYIPERDMDEHIFVISDLMVTMELLRGWPALTFHGTAEWAADHLFTHEAVWLPTEEQMRAEIVSLLQYEPTAAFNLTYDGLIYQVECTVAGHKQKFEGETAEESYANALIALLHRDEPM